MGINRQVTERWEFGRLFLDFSNPAAPIGSVVYVQRDADGAPIPDREVSLNAGPELIGPLVSQGTMPGIDVATNIVLLCDALMAGQGKIPGGVTDMEAAQAAAPSPAPAPAPAPADPELNTEDADPPPAAEPVIEPAPVVADPVPADPVPEVPADPAADPQP